MNQSKLTKFWKCQSEGNDFVLLDGRRAKTPSKATIRRLCHRITGIGANGLIVMNHTAKGWSWKFFNEDGSTADMCGNGAKCAALWLKTHGEPRKKEWQWQSALGPVSANSANGQRLWVQWPIKDALPNTRIVEALEDLLDGLNERGLAYIASIDVGIPHLVLVNHESWSVSDRNALNEQLRHHSVFGKPGTNVSWHSLATGESVTFERGVEAETLACGTGAIAIFRALEDMKLATSKATLKFPGGNLLVKREKNGLWLGGQPQITFLGQF